MSQSPGHVHVADETAESTESLLRSTLDLVDRVVDQVTPEEVEERLASLLRQAGPFLAAAAPCTEEKRRYLRETGACLNCGLNLERSVGHVTPRGAFVRWKAVDEDAWRHDRTGRRECEPSQVAYHQRMQAEAATSGDAPQ